MAGSKRVLSQTSTDRRNGGLAHEFVGFFRAIKALADPYRPELHYMRGPGPKWHAKHTSVVSQPDLGGMANASA